MHIDPTRQGGIYIIRLSDKHFYGGRAKQFKGRWRRHLSALEKGTHANAHMQAVYNQHQHFNPKILQVTSSIEASIKAEADWLDQHFDLPGCVNLNPFAHGGNGPHTEATKAKLRGKRHTDEQKLKWSRQRKGVIPSPVSIAKGIASRTGLKMSMEARKNMSKAQQGRIISDAHKVKLRAAWERRKASGQESRCGPRKYNFDLLDVVDYLDGGGSLRGACRKFMGGEGDRKSMKTWLVAIGAWPR